LKFLKKIMSRNSSQFKLQRNAALAKWRQIGAA
jgi:hypothetical protein